MLREEGPDAAGEIRTELAAEVVFDAAAGCVTLGAQLGSSDLRSQTRTLAASPASVSSPESGELPRGDP